MSNFRQLFPPVVPSSMSAYDGAQTVKFYFQISVANSRSQFKHAQVIVNRLDTNLNSLNTVDYPLGIAFFKDNEILLDSTNGMYYVVLPANLLALDFYYKVQIRFGTQDLNTVNPIDYVWLNNPATINGFSEWSNVCIVRPITIPTFGLVDFQSKDINGNYIQPVYEVDNLVNIANTPGFLFVGSYGAQDATKTETLNSYQMKLFADNGTTNEASWTLLSDSGAKFFGEYEAINIQHSFDFVLEKGTYYYVKYIVTSKNGYVGSVIYKIYVMYSEVNLYNTFLITPQQDTAKISLNVQGKQLLFEAQSNTATESIRDAADLGTIPAEILHTHMIINGTIKEDDALEYYAVKGKWVMQLRALGIKPLGSRAAALNNPVLLLEEQKTSTSAVWHKIKLCAAKYNVTFARESTQRWVNDFILVKEVWSSEGLIFRQERIKSFTVNGVVSLAEDFIDPYNEYYFYIKEDNGYMDFQASKIRRSTNAEILANTNYTFK